MRTLIKFAILGAALVGAALWWMSAPQGLSEAHFFIYATNDKSGPPPDAEVGKLVFIAGGCAACHSAETGADPLLLAGGKDFPSDFGTFYAPNISSDTQYGIGSWTVTEFATAVTLGVSPDQKHYYPAFPYTAYAGLSRKDVTDLFAYMQTLPASDTPSRAHEVGFPFNIRRGIGLWKQRYMPDSYPDPTDRGAYLVETLAHCGECHTPRDALGGLDRTRWLHGAPNPSGKGTIPGLTPAQLEWSEPDIVEYLTSGFTPEYDSAGGEMVHVIENLAQLPRADREAIAAYLLALPAP